MENSPQHANQQKIKGQWPPTYIALAAAANGITPNEFFYRCILTPEQRREVDRRQALLEAANRGIRRWRGPVTRIIAVDHERKAVTVRQEGA